MTIRRSVSYFVTSLFLLVCVASLANAGEAESVIYSVDLADAKNHYVRVEMQAVADAAQTELMMAVWTPGSYLMREYARHLDSLSVTDGEGNELAVEKTRKNRWLVQTKPGEPFHVSYRLYCNEVTVRTNFVNHRFAVLNGAPTFLTIPNRLDQAHHVRLQMPGGWKKSACSLSAGKKSDAYVAKNFDELVDSPIVAGLLDVYPFEVAGTAHQLVNVGESGYWDGAAAAEDLKKVVAEHRAMWGELPYDHYMFLNVIAEGRGGLEHDSSTLMLASRWAFRVPEKYQDWLSLASHEYFHAWNVRRLRPRPLMRYDYENEIYTASLWTAEGITSYYEDVALVRAGLIDRKEYLKRLSKSIEKVQTANGRNVQSLRDASFDTWIKFYRPDENSRNTRVSYYSKGEIAAFLLDAKIRELTANEKSLDDVMRAMYAKFLDTGYTPADFRTTASDITGQDLAAWFEHAIDSTGELDYEPALAWFGLQFEEEENEADEDGEDEEDTESDESDDSEQEPWLGVELIDDRVTAVTPDSSATEAGINWNDQLLGINGFQLHESLEKHLEQFEVGDQVELLVSRNEELLTLAVTIAAKPEANWKLSVLEEPTELQETNSRLWLGDHEDELETTADETSD